MLFKLDQFTPRKSLVLEKFLDADFELLKDILQKVILEIENIQRNKKSSAKTKTRPNSKDIDCKLSDVTIRDPHNSKKGKNCTKRKGMHQRLMLIEWTVSNLLRKIPFKKMHIEYDIDASSLNLTAANSSLHNITANLMDMLQGLISDQKYNILDCFTDIIILIGIMTLVFYFVAYTVFTYNQSTLRMLLVMEKFLVTDRKLILKGMFYKEALKIYHIERNEKSSTTTKSRSNTKDTDYKLSDVSVWDSPNSREGQNGMHVKKFF
ncbi:hypothetical protein CDAR_380011 [Caerostris darwini]|uniref:Uncharacterized protein n=1 Tax=Caerostris darwini TaxID=1538125 RepID=A0AAV4WZQ6_9ARAC|nr:hypothetical protein CDAR_380011 [Caerostris darwini]